MITWIQKICMRLLQYDPAISSPTFQGDTKHVERLIRSFTFACCMGIYIAFSPFIGFHTAMVFLFAWLFSLNFSVILAVSILINNPWTMLPVYGLSYFCGDWLLSWSGVHHYAWNPLWVLKGNELLANYVGFSGFSFWAFMVGGNLLGLCLALCAYPIIKKIATMIIQGKPKVMNTVIKSKELVRSVVAHKTNGKEHAPSGTK